MTLDSPHNLYLHLVLLREGLKRCLYRLEFQVVDFGETVSERSRARDTSGKSPSINTLFDKAGLSRERVCLSLSLSSGGGVSLQQRCCCVHLHFGPTVSTEG